MRKSRFSEEQKVKMVRETEQSSVAAEERFKTKIANRYVGRYAVSNRQTAEMTGLDLARYGYET